ncbi:fibrinogen-like protein A [Physella acuta]|uniref:fibrinogen-like protein A n=1 Tax=Physella acuta TaxID=109671 RepID=UPI0027DD1F5E|nr:fibrinogen-like protein A [Physella acuta]
MEFVSLPKAQPRDPLQLTQYKAVDDTNVTTLSINVEFDQVSLLSCASRCSSSNKTCYSYIYNKTTRHCSLGTGSWLVPLKTSQQKVQGKIFSSGKFCNTTRNIRVLSNGSISDRDLDFCTGQTPRQISCVGISRQDPRSVVTLSSGLQVMIDDQTDGGGWTIFQRRVSGTVDFYRNWTEYKNGFGDFISGNFYLGNENIYLLTSDRQTELRVDMIFNGTSYCAQYSSFNISSEADGYRLHVGGYTGDVIDQLAYHNGAKFSTYDRDNDQYPTNCANYWHGAWWYINCYNCNLNGLWGATNESGITWEPMSQASFVEMKLRDV